MSAAGAELTNSKQTSLSLRVLLIIILEKLYLLRRLFVICPWGKLDRTRRAVRGGKMKEGLTGRREGLELQ